MPILAGDSAQPTTPAEKRAAAAARLPEQVRSVARRQLQQLLQIQKNGIQLIWQHQLLTPQEACDAIGTDAAELFGAHGTLTEQVVTLAATLGVDVTSRIALPTYNFTVNPDGTVTISEDPYNGNQ